MKPGAAPYRAFLLRVWTTPRGTQARASVRDVETGEAQAFANLDQLSEWLNREMCTSTQRESVR